MKCCTEKAYVDEDLEQNSCMLSVVGRRSLKPVRQLSNRPVLIGRSRDCDVVLRDPCISTVHAQIYCRHGEYFLVDLDSTNGTQVNGRRIGQIPQRLKPGDLIGICACQLAFQQCSQTQDAPDQKFELATRQYRSHEGRRGAVRLPKSIVEWLRALAALSEMKSQAESEPQPETSPRQLQGIH